MQQCGAVGSEPFYTVNFQLSLITERTTAVSSPDKMDNMQRISCAIAAEALAAIDVWVSASNKAMAHVTVLKQLHSVEETHSQAILQIAKKIKAGVFVTYTGAPTYLIWPASNFIGQMCNCDCREALPIESIIGQSLFEKDTTLPVLTSIGLC